MARYLLSVITPTEQGQFGPYPSEEAMLQAFAGTGAFNDKLEREGHFVFADGLQPADTAKTVDARGDEPVVTDGPHTRGAEQMGGFWVVEANDMDQALALAAEASHACRGRIEVRPFQFGEADPADQEG